MLESPGRKVCICGLHSRLTRYSSSRTWMRTIGDLPGRCPVRPWAYVSMGHASARISLTLGVDAGEAGCRLRVARATPYGSLSRRSRRSRIRGSAVCTEVSTRNAVVRGDSLGSSPLRRLERPRYPGARRQEERTSPARPWGRSSPPTPNLVASSVAPGRDPANCRAGTKPCVDADAVRGPTGAGRGDNRMAVTRM